MNTLTRLRKRRRRLMKTIAAGERRLMAQGTALKALERKIGLLKPSFDPAKVGPSWSVPAKQGLLNRQIMQVAKAASAPVGVVDLMRVVTLSPAKTAARIRLRAALSYLEDQGRLQKVGKGRRARWTLPTTQRVLKAA